MERMRTVPIKITVASPRNPANCKTVLEQLDNHHSKRSAEDSASTSEDTRPTEDYRCDDV